jgi:hypothetical protein
MDSDTGSSQPQYRALEFFVRHGDLIAPVVAAVIALLGAYAWATGMPPIVLVIGVGLAAFVYLMMRVMVDLVRVIVDMLLPK